MAEDWRLRGEEQQRQKRRRFIELAPSPRPRRKRTDQEEHQRSHTSENQHRLVMTKCMKLRQHFRHHLALAVVSRTSKPWRKRDQYPWQRRVLKLECVAMLRQ